MRSLAVMIALLSALPHGHTLRGESRGAAARISFLALPTFLLITAMTASTGSLTNYEAELRHMLWTAYRHAAARRGSVGVRFPRGVGTGLPLDEPLSEIPIGSSQTLREGGSKAAAAPVSARRSNRSTRATRSRNSVRKACRSLSWLSTAVPETKVAPL